MRLAAYLSRSRHGVYYFRWPIPNRLHPERKRTHVRLSLRTRSPDTARRLSQRLVVTGQSAVASATATAMRYDEVRQLVREAINDSLERFRGKVAENGPPTGAEYDGLTNTLGIAEEDFENWLSFQQGGKDALISHFCGFRGISEERLTAESREWLVRELQKGYRAYAVKAFEHLATLDNLELEPDPLPEPAKKAGEPEQATDLPDFDDTVELYFNELNHSEQLAAKTMASKREALELLSEITDKKPIAAMTKADAQEVKRVLMKMPKNRNKLAATKGKSIHEILDIPGLEPIAARTLNVYNGNLQSFFSWAVSNGHADSNIFEGMRVKLSKNKKDDERPAFTSAQLQTMLRHITDEKARIKPDHKWIALIGMFTGMRLNEIAQLDLADVQQDSAGYAINVTKEGGEHKSLKNHSSARLVPVHERLLALGFADFVEERRKGRSTRLFPDLPYCTKNGFGRNPGRWFNEWLLPQLGLGDTGHVFHSLRHTMATVFAQADVPAPQISAILGHGQVGVTFGTYVHGFKMEQLRKAINRFDF